MRHAFLAQNTSCLTEIELIENEPFHLFIKLWSETANKRKEEEGKGRKREDQRRGEGKGYTERDHQKEKEREEQIKERERKKQRVQRCTMSALWQRARVR